MTSRISNRMIRRLLSWMVMCTFAGLVVLYGLIFIRPWVAGLGSSRLLLVLLDITQVWLLGFTLWLLVTSMRQLFRGRWHYYRRRLRVWRRSIRRKIQRRRTGTPVTGEVRPSKVANLLPQPEIEGSGLPVQQPAEG